MIWLVLLIVLIYLGICIYCAFFYNQYPGIENENNNTR